MKRRGFLKFLGIGSAAAAAVPLLKAVPEDNSLTWEEWQSTVLGKDATLTGGYISDGSETIYFDGSQNMTFTSNSKAFEFWHDSREDIY